MNLRFGRAAATLCCGFSVLFAGCALTPPKIEATVAPPPVSQPPSAADSTLADLARLQSLPATELAQRRELARDAFERDPAIFRRMHYMMTIFVAPTSPSDDDRLLALVEPLINTSDEAARVVAVIVQNAAMSRKRIRDEAAQTQRSRVLASNRRDDREIEVRSLKLRVEDLEKQLVALKTIDRSVTRR